MFRKINPTIVALSTPPGFGAIAVVRLSGKWSRTIVQKFIRPNKIHHPKQSYYVHFYEKDDILDDGIVTFFQSPRSYTGENIMEINCHGSPYIVGKIINLCLKFGAVPAKPGEFTRRAYLNGKMDLLQAESVADLIYSTTQSAHRATLNLMQGTTGKQMRRIKQNIIDLLSQIELELDFNDQEIEHTTTTEIIFQIDNLRKQIKSLIKTYSYGKMVRNGIYTPIVGPPNTGKSSLFNALLQEERVIVSPIPGTTRDSIEECFQKDGFQFRLVDTAGLRETQEPIEKKGIARTKATLSNADLILFITDYLQEFNNYQKFLPKDISRTIIVINKIDITSPEKISALRSFFPGYKTVDISAKNHIGIHELSTAMVKNIKTKLILNDDTILTQKRHFEILKRTLSHINRAKKSAQLESPPEILTVDLRLALQCMDEIFGRTTSEDILNNIFSNFCIGK